MEDQPRWAASVALELEQANVNVMIAPTGEQGLALAREVDFDLILLEQRLPGMDGLEIFRRLKSDPALQDIPVIFYTAYPSLAHESEATRLGAADYMLKGTPLAKVATRILDEVKLTRKALNATAKKNAQAFNGKPPPPPRRKVRAQRSTLAPLQRPNSER